MGNRTRQHHNMAGKKSRQPNVALIEALKDELEFPFHEVDRLTMILGANIPGYRDVLAACPQEFQDWHNRWTRLASDIFSSGADMSRWKFRNPTLKPLQVAYLKTWLGSYEPSHEDKLAVCGWLLSLMLREVPR